MESRLASGTGDARKIRAAAAALAETPADGARARRCRRAGRPAAGDRRARRHRHRRRRRPSARSPRRADRAQGGAGRRGRGTGGQLHAVEGGRRPVARHPRRVADHHRPGPQDRRRAVEALLGGPRDVQPAPRLALRRARPRTRRRQAGQGVAVRTRRGAVRLHRLGSHRRDVPRSADRVEGGGPRRQGRRRRAVAPLQVRPGQVLLRAQRGDRRTRRRVPRPTPRPRRRCSPRPRSSTPPTWKRPGRRCAPSATSGTRSARCRANAARIWSAGCARSRRRSATRRPAESIPRRRPAPSSSGPAPSNSSVRRRRPRPPAAPRTPSQARASAEQWRQWAEAAADALGRKR